MNMNSNAMKIGYISLVFLIFVFFFLGLGGYDLTAPDEPRFALVAREMLTDNHWILPHRNDNPYPDKPPFFFWTIAAFSALAGGTVNAWTTRLPSAVSATIIIFLMWQWGKTEEENSHRSILTALILMSCAKFFFQARIAQIDMVLCLFITSALLLGYKAMTGKRYRPFWLGMCLGIGILTKGPVGYLVPAGSLGLFAVFKGRSAWRKFPLKGLIWGLVPVVVWLLLLLLDVALHRQWDYLNNLLFKQTLVRYVSAWHHHQPFYYYFVSILYDFLPWTPFLVIAIPFTRLRRRSLDDQQKFAWAVILFALVFFSLSKGKRSVYILPVFPFAAYLAAAQIEILFSKKQQSWWEIGAGLFSGILVLIIGVAFIAIAAEWVKIPIDWIDTPLPRGWIVTAGLLLTAISIGILVSSFKNKLVLSIPAMVIAMLVINFLLYSVLLPWINPYRSSRNFMEQVNQIIHHQSDNPVVGMLNFRSAYRLYGDFPLVELSNKNANLPNLGTFFNQHPDGWVIVRLKDWKLFTKTHDVNATVHLTQKIGEGKPFILVTLDSN